jgi:hypothetical protein
MDKMLLIFFSLQSCFIVNGQNSLDSCFIQKLADNKDYFSKYGVPPPLDVQFLFAKGESDSVFLIEDARELEEIYSVWPYNMDYKDFLTEVLNQKTILHPHYKTIKFALNKKVASKYKQNGLKKILKSYCIKIVRSDRDRYRLKKGLSEIELYSVMYFLFINNYLTEFSDESGIYSVGNITMLFKNACP